MAFLLLCVVLRFQKTIIANSRYYLNSFCTSETFYLPLKNNREFCCILHIFHYFSLKIKTNLLLASSSVVSSLQPLVKHFPPLIFLSRHFVRSTFLDDFPHKFSTFHLLFGSFFSLVAILFPRRMNFCSAKNPTA